VRLITYRSERGDRAGVLSGDVVVDAGDALGDGGTSSVRGLLEAGALADLAAAVRGADGVPAIAVALLPPIPDPEKIVCIGLNYREHAAEGRQEPPPVPTFFAKFRNSLTADRATVSLPAASRKVDYEAEVAFVVGRAAKEVGPGEALDHIAGYTLLNDLSARDLQGRGPQWMPGKIFDGSAPCGPALVTPDEAGAPYAIAIKLILNGETMQDSDTSDLIFGIPALVADLSALMTLEPGDVVATGTPPGVGMGRDPRVWLAPGDEVVVESPTLGRLVTQIAG
jgi:2-keto-4-pentenoate hydratase/2-oxohepta-3-ene-1,7-dioic acid hydratase in catechol pathway